MIALLLAVAGLLYVAGARAESARLLRLALGLGFALSFLTCLLGQCASGEAAIGREHLAGSLAVAALALIGLLAWRLREARARAREARRRSNGQPRERALPLAPRDEEAEP